MALLERGKYTDNPEHAPGHVNHAGPGAQRTTRRAGHVGEPAHHLRDLVERGALLVGPRQKTLFGAIDEAWICYGKRAVAQTQPVERTGAEVFHQNVRFY